ncbi:hypothetical protein ACFVWY_25215 [Streptomyces sp. NPDC058195]|uniref:hypothetical protein n=1 Tax=Streptomyces sp. NPDC058195 TaxID=3346375 RepID=UPI0036EEC2D8
MPAEAPGDREEGCEVNREEFVALPVGPRKGGGRYDHGHADSEYEVVNIDRGPREPSPSLLPSLSLSRQITMRGSNGQVREHCTGRDSRRDRFGARPSADVAR